MALTAEKAELLERVAAALHLSGWQLLSLNVDHPAKARMIKGSQALDAWIYTWNLTPGAGPRRGLLSGAFSLPVSATISARAKERTPTSWDGPPRRTCLQRSIITFMRARSARTHVMLGMREVDESVFGQKVREWNRTELLIPSCVE